MNKEELIQRFCELSHEVAKQIVNFPENPADCFCHAATHKMSNFAFDERIIEYIESVVYESLKK